MDNLDMNKIILYNDELSQEEKNRRIDQLNIAFKTKHALIYKLHINTLIELIMTNTNTLKKTIDNYNELRRDLLYKEHILLYDDLKKYKDSELDLDIALIPIISLSLSKTITRRLLANGNYFFLGDIITSDYNDLLDVKGLGEKSLKELKQFIHNLGYKIKNEQDSVYEIKSKLNKDGIKTIDQDYKIDSSLIEVLFQNEIYTKADLLNIGIGAYFLPGMTTQKRGLLLEVVLKNNIKLDDLLSNEDIDNTNKTVIKQLDNINIKIKEKIKYKESLLKRINQLKKEKIKLLKEEAIIDQKLKDVVDTINSNNFVEEKSNGRK